MKTLTTTQIENALNKHGKTLKEGKRFEQLAHEITFDYLNEMVENRIQPYMEKHLVGLLGDAIENK